MLARFLTGFVVVANRRSSQWTTQILSCCARGKLTLPGLRRTRLARFNEVSAAWPPSSSPTSYAPGQDRPPGKVSFFRSAGRLSQPGPAGLGTIDNRLLIIETGKFVFPAPLNPVTASRTVSPVRAAVAAWLVLS